MPTDNNKFTMGPLHIMMMIHYYAFAEPYAVREPEHRHSRAVARFRRDLWNWGLIQPTDESGSCDLDKGRANLFARDPEAILLDHGLYCATMKGHTLIENWRKVPLPA